jgi:hypothetical protein
MKSWPRREDPRKYSTYLSERSFFQRPLSCITVLFPHSLSHRVINFGCTKMLWSNLLGALFLRSLPVLETRAGAASTDSLQDVVRTSNLSKC